MKPSQKPYLHLAYLPLKQQPLWRLQHDTDMKTLYKTHSKVNIIISGNFPIYANHVDTRAICCQNTFSQILFFSRGDATIILHLATPFPVTSQAYV